VRVESPEGQCELRLSGSTWALLIRRDKSEAFTLSATGDLSGAAASTLPAPGEDLSVGTLRLDASSHTASLDGQPVALTPTEFSILASLMSQPRRVFASQELIAAGDPRSHVSRLRRKLGGRFIVNRPGRGWSLLSE
jgi:DNA-binding response OmpR family regulator